MYDKDYGNKNSHANIYLFTGLNGLIVSKIIINIAYKIKLLNY
jgi:hypothetical protein